MRLGDEAACTEAYQFFDPVVCAVVKRGHGRNQAELVNPDEAVNRIREAARMAISISDMAKPFTPILPMEIKLELYRSDYCDNVAKQQGIERLDARAVRKITSSCLDLFI